MKRTIRFLSIAVAGLLLVACGGSNTSTTTTTAKVDTNATLRFGETSAAPDTLDPHKNNQSYGGDWYGQAYESLVFATRTREIKPQLATKWTYSADGKSIDFTLRDNVTFSDGAPFNAAAVKANIERAQTVPGSQSKTLLAPIESVVAVSDKLVRVNLKTANAGVLTDLGGKYGYMISPAAMARSDINIKPVGTGPYVLESYTPGVSATYVRNPKYWGPAGLVAKITVTTFTDTTAGVNALISNQIDLLHLFDNQSATVVRNAKQQIFSYPGLGVEWIGVNFGTGQKFQDIRVRQALAYASDRKALTDFAGTGSPAYQWVPTSSAAYDKALGEVYPYDPKKAKDLLAQAGFANGFNFTLIHTDRPYTNQSAQIMQAQWAKVGINATIKVTDGATIVNTCYVQHTCDAISGIYTQSPELTRDISDIVSTNGRRNLGTTAMPGLAEPLAAALLPSADRTPALIKLQSEFTKSVAEVNLRYDESIYGARKNIIFVDVDNNATPLWATVKMGSST